MPVCTALLNLLKLDRDGIQPVECSIDRGIGLVETTSIIKHPYQAVQGSRFKTVSDDVIDTNINSVMKRRRRWVDDILFFSINHEPGAF